MDHYGNCPECGESWDDGLIIDNFRKQKEYKDLSEEELEAKVKDWYAPPYKFSKIVGIEVMGGYDGISYWQCPFCKTTWDRFTGEKQLASTTI